VSAISLAAPTQPPQEDTHLTALAIARRSQREYARYGDSHGRISIRKFDGAYSSMVW
jgi:hypothetical protein